MEKQYKRMSAAVLPDGTLRIGSDIHCVLRKQRPPLSPTSGQPHPEDLDEDDLRALHARVNEAFAQRFGIEARDFQFIEKTSMPRAV
jgi:hypothetical protein